MYGLGAHVDCTQPSLALAFRLFSKCLIVQTYSFYIIHLIWRHFVSFFGVSVIQPFSLKIVIYLLFFLLDFPMLSDTLSWYLVLPWSENVVFSNTAAIWLWRGVDNLMPHTAQAGAELSGRIASFMRIPGRNITYCFYHCYFSSTHWKPPKKVNMLFTVSSPASSTVPGT